MPTVMIAKDDDGYWRVFSGGKNDKCCADHAKLHPRKIDAELCLWDYEMSHIEEFSYPTQDDGGDPTPCMFGHLCVQTKEENGKVVTVLDKSGSPKNTITKKGFRNRIVPHGRPLCDRHRKREYFIMFYPFIGTHDSNQAVVG